MADDLTTVQIDFETRETLRSLAKEDLRSMASELQWLVNQEYARRYSKPNPLITVADALRTPAGDALRAHEGEPQSAAAGTGDRPVAQSSAATE